MNLYHESKTYEHESTPDMKFIFEHGFMYTELPTEENGESYIYFILQYEPDHITFVDTYGSTWSQKRVENPEHIPVPAGYTKRSQ